MKKYIILYTLFSSLSAMAAGFNCQAICVNFDNAYSVMDIVGEIHVEAGIPKTETHRLLKKKCRVLSRARRYWGTPFLVDYLGIHLIPSNEDIACKPSNIQDGVIPYIGERMVL